MNTLSYTTKFGNLTFSQKVEDAYFWEASFQWKSDFYKETLELPFSVFSKSETITPDTIAFIEQILTKADKLVAKALSYFQEQLLISSEGFHLSKEEKRLLSVPLQEVPFAIAALISSTSPSLRYGSPVSSFAISMVSPRSTLACATSFLLSE